MNRVSYYIVLEKIYIQKKHTLCENCKDKEEEEEKKENLGFINQRLKKGIT